MLRRVRDYGPMDGRDRGEPGRAKLVKPGEEPGRVKARRAGNGSPRHERRQDAGHQPVAVEERHDVEAQIALRQSQRRTGIVRRGADVPVRQGDPSRPGRCARRRKYHGVIAGLREAGGDRPRGWYSTEGEFPHGATRKGCELEDRPASLLGHVAYQ